MSATRTITGAAAGDDTLAGRRATLDAFLRAAVDTLPPTTRRIVGYHLGWLDQHGAAVTANSGKAVRPTLALLAAEAVGGTVEAALPAAAAVELVHNFSLVHDDVIDRDLTRRHRPTVWSVFGLGEAILAGDALLALAYDVLAASGQPAAPAAAQTLSATVLGMIEGQYADLSFENRDDVELSECFDMVERKTAFLLRSACALGALFGGGSAPQVEQLGRFGLHLGFAFQLVDDLLGVWGEPDLTGKPVRSDLQSRKKSLPVVAALVSDTPAGRALTALYRREEPLSDAELGHAAELIVQAGGRAWSEAQRDVFLSRALHDLDLARPTEFAGAELRSVAHKIVGRDH
jgi:geranylgeranyl diphosphate synthase type I